MRNERKLKKYLICTLMAVSIPFFYLIINVLYFFINPNSISYYLFLKLLLYTFIVGSVLMILLNAYITKKPFCSFVIYTLLFLALLFFIYSFVLPKISLHQQIFPFRILDNGQSYLMDGWYFTASLVILFFSRVVKYGGQLQDEVDDTI